MVIVRLTYVVNKIGIRLQQLVSLNPQSGSCTQFVTLKAVYDITISISSDFGLFYSDMGSG